MEALLILLTPILLLALVALFGFVGCGFTPGSTSSSFSTVVTADAATQTLMIPVSGLSGGELLVATVQWGSPAIAPPAPAFSGGPAFAAVDMAGPFVWGKSRVQVFSGTNTSSTDYTITVTLSDNSPVQWSVCIEAFGDSQSAASMFSPVTNGTTFVGSAIQSPPITLAKGDTLYAVAYAADSDGTFPGSNSLSAPSGYSVFADSTNPLFETWGAQSAGSVTGQATNSNTNNPKGFIVALGITYS